jgi:hypothetical protein
MFMRRQLRIDTSGALHHVICRGIDRQKIFTDQDDYLIFLKRLADLLIETNEKHLAKIPSFFDFDLSLSRELLKQRS